MNVTSIKLACWLASAGLSVGLTAYAYGFFKDLEANPYRIDPDHVAAVLGEDAEVQRRSLELIAYEEVLRSYRELNWTGAAAPQVVESAPVEPVEARDPRTPVADLLDVLMIQIDAADPDGSSIFVRYTGGGISDREGVLQTGDALPSPQEEVRVHAIRIDGVEFAFADEDRPHETILARDEELETLIVKVGPDGIRYPVGPRIPQATNEMRKFRPEETTEIAPGRFRLGTEDAAYINENYAQILTREVRYRTWHDPRTGRRAGIEIQDVQPGSIAERHGVRGGDVIISINGEPVASEQEAIKFVKNHADQYKSWDVVVENLGRRRTITYESPN